MDFKQNTLWIPFLVVLCFCFGPHCLACGVLVPWSGMEPPPAAMEAQSLNHWATKEVPWTRFQRRGHTASRYDAEGWTRELGRIPGKARTLEQHSWQQKKQNQEQSGSPGSHNEGLCLCEGFPGGSAGKESPAMQETWVQSLGWEDPLAKGTATHSSILAWRTPWTKEPGGLQSMGPQRGN